MFEWFTYLHIVLALAVGIVAAVQGIRGRAPSDLTVVPAAGLAVLLIVQVIVAIIAPLVGNPPTGDPLEFWMYLFTDVVMLPAIVVFALVERTRWATLGIALVAMSSAVMVFRMQVIWAGL
ncbi:hypothetical protein C8A06_1342 [Microbacteriaceae bacterium MWH-Ta3]|nr:hypothetical protein C8A06_1342 [Microbacteriaceae bacterium MWH-Ta3]